MPGCWPTVVWRSAGVTRVAMVRMIRAGTIRRVSTWRPGSAALSPVRAARRAVAAGAAAALLGGARWPGRGLDQARGPPAARVRWQQAAQPGVPGGRRAGRGRRLPRHVWPALVEPRPPDSRGRGEGRAGGPSRPVRPAGRPAQPGRSARRAVGGDRPPGGDRRPRREDRHRRTRHGRPSGRRTPAVPRGHRRHRDRRGGRAGPRGAGARRGRGGRRSRPDTIVVPSATGGTQAGLLVGLRTAGLPTTSTGSPSRPRSRCGPSSRPSPRAWPSSTAWPPSTTARSSSTARSSGTATAGRPRRPTRRPGSLARTEGILVDPIYTAKALAGLVALVRDGALDGTQVVFWHAGGTPGLFEPLDG